MTTPRPDIFLSYSRDDQAIARRFAEGLQREGFSVWWDQTLSTGEAYDAVTEQALDSARAVVVLWSKTSVASRWVRAEATTGDRNGVLMPVMIGACRRPVMFELMQTAELGHWNGDSNDPAWRAFVADLKRLVLRGQPPEAALLLERAQQDSPAPLPPAPPPPQQAGRPNRWLGMAGIAVGVAVLAAGYFYWQRMARLNEARVAVQEISQLVDKGEYQSAFARAAQVRREIPDDPVLASLLPLFTTRLSFQSQPAGAEVLVRGYTDIEGKWQRLGVTPLPDVEVPRGVLRWRVEKPGFRRVEMATPQIGASQGVGGYLSTGAAALDIALKTTEEQPEDMVYVPAGASPTSSPNVPSRPLPPFFIDRHEVTNAQYKEFVAAGGYERRSLWQGLEYRSAGRTLTHEEALRRFVDGTGRPGPAGWELGTYPEGTGDHPVAGISWYEAMAYARFRNRTLPTGYHWSRASLPENEITGSLAAAIAPLSNYAVKGPAPVGQYQGMGPFGTYDMFGNVREWLLNAGPGGGWAMGGSWEDAPYSYVDMNSQPLMERSPKVGMRLIRELVEPEDAATLRAPLDPESSRRSLRDFRPVGDEVYATFQRQFAYRSGPLNASQPATMYMTQDWIKQRVTLDAGYNNERFDVILFIPRNAAPPFQPIVFFSGFQIFLFPQTVEDIDPGFAAYPLDFVVKSGRVLVQPIFQGSYERLRAPANFGDEVRTTAEYIQRRWDMGRTIDYLQTRPDMDTARLGYIGTSFGASYALPLVAQEQRFKAAVFMSGGLVGREMPPLLDPANYAGRITMPVLMINGRFDPFVQVDALQVPLFRMLGTPAKDKRHVLMDFGHGSPPRAETLRELLGWFDKYLGPVQP